MVMVFLISAAAANASDANQQSKHYHFDIPAQIVHEALDQVAKQTGYQLLVSSDLTENLTSTAVQGHYTVQRALAELLKGTGLVGRLTARGVIVVHYPKAQSQTIKGEEKMNRMNSKKRLLASVVGFFVGTGGASGVIGQGAGGWVLEEVVITANKRSSGQGVHDTPMSIIALSSETIEKRGFDDIGDYANTLPFNTAGVRSRRQTYLHSWLSFSG